MQAGIAVNNVLYENIHPISVAVIGAGGNGSQIIDNLAKINVSLQIFGRQPLEVTIFDDDKVSESNHARQLFSLSDIGQYKSHVLASRVNRFYGTNWLGKSTKFDNRKMFNIYIICVDSVASRKEIYSFIEEQRLKIKNSRYAITDYKKMYYAIDIGNSKNSGQIIIGDISDKRNEKLPTFIEMFPNIQDEEVREPSCSMIESLSKQSLFINRIMATYASQMLYQMLTEYVIDYRGLYVNLETMQTNKIKI
jgi:PRTRC genetic system ThiF family protein